MVSTAPRMPRASTPGHIGTGAPGYLAYGLEAVKGVPVSVLNKFLAVTANGISGALDQIRQDAFVGSRHTEAIADLGKAKIAGNLVSPWWAGQGVEFLLAALGKDIFHAALAPDTTSGAAVINGGITTVTLTNTAAVTYVKGALAVYGTAPFIEPVQITDITGNGAAGTVVSFKKLKPTSSLLTGATFTQIDQNEFTIRGDTDTEAWELPTLTLEENEGRQFAWRLPGVRVSKVDMRGQKEIAEITHTVSCTEPPIPLDPTVYTPYTPTVDERTEWRRPFTVRDGFVVASQDQGAGRMVQMLAGLQEWNLSWDNTTVEENFWNDSFVKDNFPTKTSGRITYKYGNIAGRWAEWDDYLFNRDAPPMPFFLTLARKMYPALTQPFYAIGVYCPEAKVMNAPQSRMVNQIMSASVDLDILPPSDGSKPISIFVANGDTAAYVGS